MNMIALALSLVPEAAQCLLSLGDESAGTVVTNFVNTLTGTSDADAAATFLQHNPLAASQLRLKLLQFSVERQKAAHDVELADLKTTLVACLRTQAGDAPNDAHMTAWSAPIISGMVLTCFGIVVAMVLTRGVSAGNETAANMLLGTLAAMATSVVSYWVGSSAGSARKDERIIRGVK